MVRRYSFASARGFFITGTDTGVGKTVVTGAIARCLSAKGIKVGVFKPIATGCERRREGLVSRDAEFLAHCSNSEQSLEEINPIRYSEPLAPLVAAERSRRQVDFTLIEQAYTNVVSNNDLVLVEGIGGLMVPIERDYMVLDLMEDMALPVIIVAASRLGTINHTLLTIQACQQRSLQVAGVVINKYNPEQADLAEETNPRVISNVGQVRIIAVIPYDKSTCVEKGRLGPEITAAAALVNFSKYVEKGGKKHGKP